MFDIIFGDLSDIPDWAVFINWKITEVLVLFLSLFLSDDVIL